MSRSWRLGALAVRSLGEAQNRLKTVTLRNPTPGAWKVKFVYDYMGRRVRKAVYTYDNGWPANPGQVEHFVYDGWNVVMILNANEQNEVVREYNWGLDLSGTIHGAGGIGGLLAVEETQGAFQGAYWYFYDGNGNVGQVIKASDQSIAARYEYDPYGNIIGPDDDQLNDPGYGDWRDDAGPYALANPIRFSTKWFDAETGLGYWGKRYYSPRLGRWTTRDPAGEEAGLNLMQYARSTPVMVIDSLGELGLIPGPIIDLACCACVTYAEAGGENDACKKAVVSVMVNRMIAGWSDFKGEDTFCSTATSGRVAGPGNKRFKDCMECPSKQHPLEIKAQQASLDACLAVLGGEGDPTGGAQYWFTAGQAPDWMRKQVAKDNCKKMTIKGCNLEFYKCTNPPR